MHKGVLANTINHYQSIRFNRTQYNWTYESDELTTWSLCGLADAEMHAL